MEYMCSFDWVMGRGWKSFEICARNMDIKGDSLQGIRWKLDRVIGIWKKGDPCYKMGKILVLIVFKCLWKTEFASIEIGYLAEDNS